MRILVLRNLGKGLPPYGEGQVVDADDDEAKALVESGLAEPAERVRAVTPPARKLKGVPPADAGAAEK